MKAYPSIGTAIDRTHSYHLFDKLDGSNIRAEWSPKQGFYKFGTRTQLLSEDQVALYPAKAKFLATYADALHAQFVRRKFPRALAFVEYAGPHSFAGSHPDPVEAMGVTLFDIAVHQKGLLAPEPFLELAAGLPTPALVYQGHLTEEVIAAIREGTWPGVTFEGVIGKGPFQQKCGGPVQFKLKSFAWLERLRHYCGTDQALFERLR
jgi:hypothetical protein